MLKINYPWVRPEPAMLLWRLPADPVVLRKARDPLPASRSGAFMRLVDLMSRPEGRAKFPRLLRDLANVGRVRRAPRIVGVAR